MKIIHTLEEKRLVGAEWQAAALDAARSEIVAAGYREVEYLERRAEVGLAPMRTLDRPARPPACRRASGRGAVD